MHTLLIVAALALGQQPVGNFLPRPEYQTYATKTYYVAADGGIDSGPCTSALAPCATLNGVYSKLPARVRHDVLINLAAGTYNLTSTQRLEGVETMGLNASAVDTSITLQGSTTWNNVTPSSGSGSGTLTGFTALSFPTRAILTDSSQSWPTTAGSLNIKGQWVCITSGTANGQKFMIHGNTATTLEIAATAAPLPTTGSTYQLCTPSTVISWPSPGTSIDMMQFRNGGGSMTINDITVSGTNGPSVNAGYIMSFGTGSTATAQRTSWWHVVMNRVRLTHCSILASGVLNLQGNVRVQTSNSSVIADTQAVGCNASSGIRLSNNTMARGATTLSLVQTYVRAQRDALTATGSQIGLSGATIESDNISSGAFGMSVASTDITGVTNGWIRCTAGGTNFVPGISMRLRSTLQMTSLHIKGCGSAITFNEAVSPPVDASTNAGSIGVSLSTTTRLRIEDAWYAGIHLAPGVFANFNDGGISFSNIADGGRDYLCPNGVNGYSDSQVQALPERTFTCRGAEVYR